MGRPSARARRSDVIAALVAASGSVRLRDLARELGVSEMTLRRDAQYADAGFACLGGHVVPVGAGAGDDYDMDRALRREVDAKRTASRNLLTLLEPGMSIFVDCGSTTAHLGSLLTADSGIFVVTHSLPLADQLVRRGVAVELLGGKVRPETRAAHSDTPHLPPGLDLAVLTASGIAAESARCAFVHEAAIKCAAMAAAPRAVLLADTTKRQRGGGFVFAALAEFEALVSEDGIERR